MTEHRQPAPPLGYYPHRFVIETRPSDGVDGNGHIPNGRIAQFGDDARLAMHSAIMGDGDPSSLQLVETRFRFFHELTWPGRVTIGVGIVAIGTSSLRQIAGYFCGERCHVLADFVLVKAANGASAPLTAAERERARPYLIPE